jgi:hypothetical protein
MGRRVGSSFELRHIKLQPNLVDPRRTQNEPNFATVKPTKHHEIATIRRFARRKTMEFCNKKCVFTGSAK